MFHRIHSGICYFCLCLLAAVCFLEGVSRGQQIVEPENTATLAGFETSLLCTTNHFSGISWKFWNQQIVDVDAGPGKPIGSCKIRAAYANIYNVVTSNGTGMCNLVILNSTLYQSGTYSCISNNVERYAELIVLETPPQCSTNATNNNFEESDSVLLTCGVTFNGSEYLRPKLEWLNQMPPGDTTYPNDTFAFAPWIWRTPGYDIPTQICKLSFSSPSNSTPNASNSQPNCTSVCESANLTHQWCPKSVNIDGASDGKISPGGTLTCTSSANPGPTYEWLDGQYKLISTGPTLVVWNSSVYTCNATNIIDGSPCSRYNNTNITVVDVVVTTTLSTTLRTTHPPSATVNSEGSSAEATNGTTTEKPATPPDTGLIVGLIVGFIVLLIIVGLVIFWYIRKRKRDIESNANRNLLDSAQDSNQHSNPSCHDDITTEKNTTTDLNERIIYEQLQPLGNEPRHRKPVHLLEGSEIQYARIISA